MPNRDSLEGKTRIPEFRTRGEQLLPSVLINAETEMEHGGRVVHGESVFLVADWGLREP